MEDTKLLCMIYELKGMLVGLEEIEEQQGNFEVFERLKDQVNKMVEHVGI